MSLAAQSGYSQVAITLVPMSFVLVRTDLWTGGPGGLGPPSRLELESALLKGRVVGVPGSLFRTDISAAAQVMVGADAGADSCVIGMTRLRAPSFWLMRQEWLRPAGAGAGSEGLGHAPTFSSPVHSLTHSISHPPTHPLTRQRGSGGS